jgi:hypothetical protein
VWVREGVVVKEGEGEGGREGGREELSATKKARFYRWMFGMWTVWISFIGKVKMLPLAFILYELWFVKGNNVLFGCIPGMYGFKKDI